MDVEDYAETVIKLGNGVYASVHLDCIREDYTRKYEFVGSKGTLIADVGECKVKIKGVSRERELICNRDVNHQYLEEIRAYCKYIENGIRSQIASGEDGLRALEACLMIKRGINHA